MSVMYCEYHDVMIDTDCDVEHFDEDGNCVAKLEDDEKQMELI